MSAHTGRSGRSKSPLPAPGRTGGFSRADRLRVSRDYKRVASAGIRASSREFVLLMAPAAPQPTGRVRLGITASRRVGNAVVRNRIKRCVRSWFRTARHGVEADRDLVVIARRAAADLSSREIASQLDRALSRLHRGGARAVPA